MERIRKLKKKIVAKKATGPSVFITAAAGLTLMATNALKERYGLELSEEYTTMIAASVASVLYGLWRGLRNWIKHR